MWRFGGFALIERLGERAGEFMRLPFQRLWESAIPPTADEMQQFGQMVAEQFLNLVSSYETGKPERYGGIGGITVTFLTFQF